MVSLRSGIGGAWLSLFLCAIGSIGISATEAFAVAGKFTSAPPGVTALSGGSLTLELDQPVDGKTEVTVPVNPQGEFATPAGVDERNVKGCRYTNDKGETSSFRCGGYLAFGAGTGAAAMAGGSSAAQPLGKLLGSTTLRFSAFGGYNLANDVSDISGTGTFSGNNFSKFDTTNGFAAGAGIDWILQTGWIIGAHYQHLQQGIKGQTVIENGTTPRPLIGGMTRSNVVAFNFGYIWSDCWKLGGKPVGLELGAGPVVGSTTFSSFEDSARGTRAATGYNARASLHYPLGHGVSGFISYQFMHLDTNIDRININGGPRPIHTDLNSHVIRFGVEYDMQVSRMFNF
jgi:opacity protein-like surface antigen